MNRLILKGTAQTTVLRSLARFAFTYICVGALAISWTQSPLQIDAMSAAILKAMPWSLYVSVIATVISTLFEIPKLIPEKFATMLAEMVIILISITIALVASYAWSSGSTVSGSTVTLITIVTAAGSQVCLSLMRGHFSHRKDLNLWR